MKHLKLDLSRNVPRGATFASAGDAIAHAKQSAQTLTEGISSRIAGRQLQSISYDDTTFVAHLNSSEDVLIRALETAESPTIEVGNQCSALRGSLPAAIELSTPTQAWIWDREALRQGFQGRKLKRLFHNGSELYMYFYDAAILCFRCVYSEGSTKPMLYWVPTD